MDDGFVSGVGDEFDPAQVSSDKALLAQQAEEATQKAVDGLRRRQEAYKRVFQGNADNDDLLLVMSDLRRFCRGDTSVWDADHRVHALLTGRQEVYIRIMDHTRLSFDALLEKYA